MINNPKHILSDYLRLREEYYSTTKKFFNMSEEDKEYDKFYQLVSWSCIKQTDALALTEILLHLKPKKILEIGSFLGLSTRWILEVSEAWGGQVTSIDPNDTPLKLINKKTRPYFNQLCAPHKDRLTTIDAFASFAAWQTDEYKDIPVVDSPIDEFDFIFIDGDHAFNAVIQNTALAASMMPQGGVIVGHDTFSQEDVVGATSIVADALGSLEFYFVSRAEVSLGSIWKRAQWKEEKEFRDYMWNWLPPRGRQDGLTMMHVPKSETTRASSVPLEELYGKTAAKLRNRLLPKREKILKKHLLKRTIADQLRRWGYDS